MKLTEDLDKLNNNEIKIQYEKIYDQYQKLQRELDNKFSNIRKALRKFVNLNSKSKNPIDTSMHKEFITDVASTMAKQNSIMGIKSMLTSLDEEMKKGALKLKKDKKEAARNDIDNFLKEDLQKSWELVKEITARKTEIKDQLNQLELEKNIEKLLSTINAAKRDRNRIIEREIRDLENRRSDFDKLFNELSEQDYISIEMEQKLPELPDWANIIE